jgi:phosphatidylethanolamine/phosphatidyl-N-methylethanolamine N-methyltransferase
MGKKGNGDGNGNGNGNGRSMEGIYSFYSPFYDLIFGKVLEAGRRLALTYLKEVGGKKVLEVGIGTGLTLRHYPKNCHIVGIDISARMIDRARERAARMGNGHKIDLEVMDACHMTFEDNSFDAVISPYVITTVGDPHQFCREILRVCKPGGQIIIVNHSKDPDRLFGKLGAVASPFFARIGFVTDLDVVDLVKHTDIEVRQIIDCNYFNLHKVILGHKPRPQEA